MRSILFLTLEHLLMFLFLLLTIDYFRKKMFYETGTFFILNYKRIHVFTNSFRKRKSDC